ncbi:MAG: carbamoylphosphate synthase large subunit [Schwartzia sp.]|nr:carbamoylphosphate synthase large subunit [Schwartzia sp. (in: firmicutes)]
MNFVFISPHFPKTYWLFCDRLKRNGANVLGIGDCPYDALEAHMKASLTEYYFVENMQDYDQMLRAAGFFTFKYGKIDWIESNNEFWLEQDARLRTDFHVTTGEQAEDIGRLKHKSSMKPYYKKAGVATARLAKIPTAKDAKDFLKKVGYPVIVKPDIGVGANDTYRLDTDAELDWFFREKPPVPYVMEEFVTGNIYSYDAIINSAGEPLFESMTAWPPSIMDIVLKQTDLAYYVAADMPDDFRKAGRETVKAFGVKSRFVHLEFFRLAEAKKGLGKKGAIVGLEVNMRPAGGYTPDMMNFAHSTDVYRIWADMVTADKRLLPDSGDHQFCVYAGRRDCHDYVHTHEDVMARYGENVLMHEPMPPMMQPQMGNYMYTARLRTEADAKAFIHFVQEQE